MWPPSESQTAVAAGRSALVQPPWLDRQAYIQITGRQPVLSKHTSHFYQDAAQDSFDINDRYILSASHITRTHAGRHTTRQQVGEI